MEPNEPTTSMPRVRRRTVAKGAAWSVPAIAVGIAAPSASASGVVPQPGDICKETGQDYRVFLTTASVGTQVTYTFKLSATDIFFTDSSPTTGAGVTFTLCGLTATAADLTYDPNTLTYTLVTTVTSPLESFPFLVIGNVNIDSSGTRTITITENGEHLVTLQSNYDTCPKLGWNKAPYTCQGSTSVIQIPA